MASNWDDPEARRHLLDTWLQYNRQVYDGQVRQLMQNKDAAVNDLVRKRQDEADHLFWAPSHLIDLSSSDPAALLPFILDVVARDEAWDEGLDGFSAGLFEDYLRFDAAIDGLPEIERLAANNPRMRMMLEGVWIVRKEMNPQVYDRCLVLGCIALDAANDEGEKTDAYLPSGRRRVAWRAAWASSSTPS